MKMFLKINMHLGFMVKLYNTPYSLYVLNNTKQTYRTWSCNNAKINISYRKSIINQDKVSGDHSIKAYRHSSSVPPKNNFSRQRSLPRLMNFPEVIWPSALKIVKNWITVRLIICPYFDNSFRIEEFIYGAKQALQFFYCSSVLIIAASFSWEIRIITSHLQAKQKQQMIHQNKLQRCVACKSVRTEKVDVKTRSVCDLCLGPNCPKHYIKVCECCYLSKFIGPSDDDDSDDNNNSRSTTTSGGTAPKRVRSRSPLSLTEI